MLCKSLKHKILVCIIIGDRYDEGRKNCNMSSLSFIREVRLGLGLSLVYDTSLLFVFIRIFLQLHSM